MTGTHPTRLLYRSGPVIAALIVFLDTACSLQDAPAATPDTPIVRTGLFLSDGARLSYQLELPGEGPSPGVVYIHGSGRETKRAGRSQTGPLFNAGIARLHYDKRGAGESEGVYTGVGVANSDQALRQLARDAAAAAAFLATVPEVDPRRIGVVGNSQGGWIAPITVLESEHVSFGIIFVGPTVSVGAEIFYSSLAEGTTTSFDDLSAALAEFQGPHGYAPLPTLTALTKPLIWFYGQQDRSIPTKESVEILETLRASHDKPNDWIVFPTAGHNLANEDFITPMLRWVQDQGIVP